MASQTKSGGGNFVYEFVANWEVKNQYIQTTM